jgi:hypothetical protein
MNVSIETKTVHGTDRGGEDLFLVVELTSEKHPNELTEAEVDEAWEATVASLTDDEADDPESSDDLLVKNGVLKSGDTGYGFSVSKPVAWLKERVRKLAKDGDWMQRVRTGTFIVEEEIFCGGNAD